ncbi:hypothetical protein [Anthocerotibacter panamensis]|uniref:hypothetical protein n=1 Tax=Anthocerotibacter panamensis TaxID=2857077 RepID=UPI001C40815C|nr:hypothetical protein [Anthocerotibacter panamensis]
MNTIADRYVRLGRCYVQLADQFAELDLEHMKLKRQLMEVLKMLKATKQETQNLEASNKALTRDLEALEQKYQKVQPFEQLLDPEVHAELLEAEKAITLIDETLWERSQDPDPSLSPAEKILIADYVGTPALPTAEAVQELSQAA